MKEKHHLIIWCNIPLAPSYPRQGEICSPFIKIKNFSINEEGILPTLFYKRYILKHTYVYILNLTLQGIYCRKYISIIQSVYYFSFFTFFHRIIKSNNSSMTRPYFSSTSHKKFFFSSPVHRSAHENIKIRQYMFKQRYVINYIKSAKSSITESFFHCGTITFT